MKTISELIEKLDAVDLTAASWYSDRKAILEIAKFAAGHGVGFTKIPAFSRLRAIVPEGRKAMQTGDIARIADLFRLAETHTFREILLALSARKREVIRVHEMDGGRNFQITVTAEQLAKIENANLLQFEFLKEDTDNFQT